jgi:hypothetical protein
VALGAQSSNKQQASNSIGILALVSIFVQEASRYISANKPALLKAIILKNGFYFRDSQLCFNSSDVDNVVVSRTPSPKTIAKQEAQAFFGTAPDVSHSVVIPWVSDPLAPDIAGAAPHARVPLSQEVPSTSSQHVRSDYLHPSIATTSPPLQPFFTHQSGPPVSATSPVVPDSNPHCFSDLHIVQRAQQSWRPVENALNPSSVLGAVPGSSHVLVARSRSRGPSGLQQAGSDSNLGNTSRHIHLHDYVERGFAPHPDRSHEFADFHNHALAGSNSDNFPELFQSAKLFNTLSQADSDEATAVDRGDAVCGHLFVTVDLSNQAGPAAPACVPADCFNGRSVVSRIAGGERFLTLSLFPLLLLVPFLCLPPPVRSRLTPH